MSRKAIPSRMEAWKKIIVNAGFDRFGYSTFEEPISLGFYKSWLEQNYHGEMTYLERHLPFKENPELLLKGASGSICIALPYKPHPKPKKLPGLKIASYADGEDYHHFFQKRLEEISLSLQKEYKNESFLPFTDSKPLLERELGYKAGLGWVGKNTCLIDQSKGSFFFLGEIVTTLKVEEKFEVKPDRCGTCTRCIDACPTDALIEPKKMDATKCISYLTIESRKLPPLELRSAMGSWYFGCDICQDVCPWNEKALNYKYSDNSPEPDKDNTLEKDLLRILSSSNTEIKNIFEGTPLTRTSPVGHRRNAIVVATNLNLKSAVPLIEKFRDHDTLSELAQWSLDKLSERISK